MNEQRVVTLRDAAPHRIRRAVERMERRGFVLAHAIGQPSLVWWSRPMLLVFERRG